MNDLTIRPVSPVDYESIARIYNHYILNTVITFEEAPVSAQVMAARVAEVFDASLPWLVAEVDGMVTGYAYATRWKSRSAYRHTVETTVYLENGRERQGLGARLYGELISVLREQGLHVAIGGAALPNNASAALHEKLGFEHVATFRQVGFKQGRWVDVAYWQIVL
ncbi:MAG: arsinothricin resistance N-acetyltransferase ArsN1 family B [Pseudomonadota bacterium]